MTREICFPPRTNQIQKLILFLIWPTRSSCFVYQKLLEFRMMNCNDYPVRILHSHLQKVKGTANNTRFREIQASSQSVPKLHTSLGGINERTNHDILFPVWGNQVLVSGLIYQLCEGRHSWVRVKCSISPQNILDVSSGSIPRLLFPDYTLPTKSRDFLISLHQKSREARRRKSQISVTPTVDGNKFSG